MYLLQGAFISLLSSSRILGFLEPHSICTSHVPYNTSWYFAEISSVSLSWTSLVLIPLNKSAPTDVCEMALLYQMGILPKWDSCQNAKMAEGQHPIACL